MNKVMKEMISTLLYLLGVLCLTWLVITFVGQRTEVDGSSMEPMLSNGEIGRASCRERVSAVV